MMFKKLNEAIEINRVKEVEITLEEREIIENELIFGNVFEDMDKLNEAVRSNIRIDDHIASAESFLSDGLSSKEIKFLSGFNLVGENYDNGNHVIEDKKSKIIYELDMTDSVISSRSIKKIYRNMKELKRNILESLEAGQDISAMYGFENFLNEGLMKKYGEWKNKMGEKLARKLFPVAYKKQKQQRTNNHNLKQFNNPTTYDEEEFDYDIAYGDYKMHMTPDIKREILSWMKDATGTEYLTHKILGQVGADIILQGPKGEIKVFNLEMEYEDVVAASKTEFDKMIADSAKKRIAKMRLKENLLNGEDVYEKEQTDELVSQHKAKKATPTKQDENEKKIIQTQLDLDNKGGETSESR